MSEARLLGYSGISCIGDPPYPSSAHLGAADAEIVAAVEGTQGEDTGSAVYGCHVGVPG
jgi:hypothetical protein